MTSATTAAKGPWGPGATIAWTVVIAGVFAATQGVLAIPYLLLTAPDRSAAGIEAAAASLGRDGRFLGIAETVSATLVVALTLFLAWLRRGPPVRQYLGLEAAPRGVTLRWLLYTVAAVALFEVAAHVAGYPSVPDWMIDVYRTARSLPLLVFATVVAAPVVEEVVFRGFLFEGLRRSWLGDAGTIFLTALLWASIHLGQYQMFYVAQIFVLGLALGLARTRTGSLLTAMAMHALVNVVATLQVALETR